MKGAANLTGAAATHTHMHIHIHTHWFSSHMITPVYLDRKYEPFVWNSVKIGVWSLDLWLQVTLILIFVLWPPKFDQFVDVRVKVCTIFVETLINSPALLLHNKPFICFVTCKDTTADKWGTVRKHCRKWTCRERETYCFLSVFWPLLHTHCWHDLSPLAPVSGAAAVGSRGASAGVFYLRQEAVMMSNTSLCR